MVRRGTIRSYRFRSIIEAKARDMVKRGKIPAEWPL